MAMNTITPSAGRTRNALAIATPSKKVCSSSATSAYSTALDTGEQVRLRVAGGILEHLGEQALERVAHVWARSHAGGEEVVARDGEVLQRQGVLPLSHGAHGFWEKGEGRSTHRRQSEQIVGVLAHLRQPLSDRRKMLRIWILIAPYANRTPPLD